MTATIDGVDISILGVRYLGMENSGQSITNNLFYPAATGSPILLSQEIGRKTVTFRFAAISPVKDIAYRQYSRLMAALSKPQAVKIIPQGSEFTYSGFLLAGSVTKRRRGTVWEFTAQMAVVQTTATKTINIVGDTTILLDCTAPTPAVATLTVTSGSFPSGWNFSIGDYWFSMNTVKYKSANAKNVIDGENSTVKYVSVATSGILVGGSQNAISAYESTIKRSRATLSSVEVSVINGLFFPILTPVTNVLKFTPPSGVNYTFTLEYSPRWY